MSARTHTQTYNIDLRKRVSHTIPHCCVCVSTAIRRPIGSHICRGGARVSSGCICYVCLFVFFCVMFILLVIRIISVNVHDYQRRLVGLCWCDDLIKRKKRTTCTHTANNAGSGRHAARHIVYMVYGVILKTHTLFPFA